MYTNIKTHCNMKTATNISAGMTNRSMKFLTLIVIMLSALLLNVQRGWGQVLISSTGSYSQNFNTLITSGSTNWADNSTIANWYAKRSGTAITFAADAGATNTGNLYSYGTGISSDRALGSLGSGNAAAGDFAYGVLLKNTSGNAISDIKVTYTLEQWRNGGNNTINAITFWYKKSSSAITALNPNSNGTWTQVTDLTLNSPIVSSTAVSLDGNAAANKVTATSISIPSLSLSNNEFIMLKWDDPDQTGSDQGLGIDDVTISWTIPTITVTAIASAINTTYGTPSPSPTTFNVSGQDMTAGILITPAAGYELSQTPGGASGYANTQTVGAAGTISTTAIYVRLKADAPVSGNPYAGTISCTSAGAHTENLATVSSTVSPAPLTITANNRSKNYNTSLVLGTSAFTAALQNGETIGSVTLSDGGEAASAATPAGTYAIIPSAATGGTFTAGNYSISYVNGTLTVNPVTQTITFDALGAATYGDAPITLTATGGASGNAVTFASSDPSVASVSGNTLTILKNGSVTITASQAGNANYQAAVDVSHPLTINKKTLTLTGPFNALDKVYDGNTNTIIDGFTVSGIVGSDIVLVDPLGNFDNPNVGNPKNVTASFTIVVAGQGARYQLPALPTGLTAAITPVSLTISGLSAANKPYDNTTAATLSGTPVLNGVIGSDDVSVGGTATANFISPNAGNNITVTVTGYTLSGTAAGNYTLQQPAGLTANITTASQSITFDALPAKFSTDPDFALTATASSGLAVSYVSDNPAVATITGNLVHITGAGIANITASQAGNANYNPAADATRTLTVTDAPTVTEYFVNDGFTTGDVFTTAAGDDFNPGTAGAPFATLGKALSLATDGQTIWVDAGTYATNAVTINKNVKIYGSNYNSSPVTGYAHAPAVLDFTADAPSASVVHMMVNAPGTVEIKGLRIEDNNFITAAGIIRNAIQLATSNGHVIANNLFYRDAGGVNPGLQSTSEIRAIYLDPTATGNTVTIDNNWFTGSSAGIFGNQSWRRAIWKQSGTGTTNITNNSFDKTRSHLNLEDNVSNTNISNNTFDLGATGIGSIAFGGAPVLDGTYILGANNFKGAGSFINMSSAVAPTFVVDISSSSYEGTPMAALSLAQLFEVEVRVIHGPGFVRVRAGNDYVVLSSPFTGEKGSIQNIINKATAGDVVHVDAGTYNVDVNVNKTLTLSGAGAATTIIRGAIGGPVTTVGIAASNVEVSGFTITRAGNNPTDWNDPNLNSAGVAVQGVSISGMNIHDNIITGNRSGIDINNSNGHTIHNNVITNNRTGLIFRNQTDNISFGENEVTNNWTAGILFLDASGGTNVPVQSAVNSNFNKNNISGNWYAQVVDRQSGGSLPAPGANLKNFACNWWGATPPAVTTANSAEPGYATQIPVAFGGTATAPGGQPDIAGAASANITYIPYLSAGTDANVETAPGRGTFGFQPSVPCVTCALVLGTASTPAGCAPATDGTATVSVTSGGVAPYTYSWNTSPVQTNATATGLSRGNTYTATVTDANGCSATASVTIGSNLAGPVHNVNTGLNYCTIQAAINDPLTLAGHVINADAGTYKENIIVNKSVTLHGASQSGVIIEPAVSGPTCAGGSICAGGSNVILVQANNVFITNLTIDGDNPSLTSGVVSGGADIDARNGIITDHTSGVYNNLTVDHVTIKNIYLRGVYASSGGSFTFTNNTLDNIKADASAIGLFNFGGSGLMANNTVSNANDAIASNHSTGTEYYGNTVTASASGIHTDNNGDAGGTGDNIHNNNVNNSVANGYGIWVFAPYRDVTVKDNSITNVDVAVANAGQGAAVTTHFTGNTINGMGKVNSTGVYQTSDMFGFGNNNVSGIYLNNFITNTTDAFYLEYHATRTNSITVNSNSITGNTHGVNTTAGATTAGTLVNNLNCNWWGTAASHAAVAAAAGPATGINFTPFLVNGTDADVATTGFQPAASACPGGPVHNLTQNLYYTNIQPAVNAAHPNDVIELAAFLFNEKVVIDKAVTIQGVDKLTSIVDGTGLGIGSGIYINTGVTNVTIKNVTVRNHQGANGNSNAGIYANGGNNNFTVNNSIIQNNTNGSGIYANGPVNGVTYTNNTISGHLVGARGIVIWNGLKENITITGNEVFNNNCCGIELQDGTGSGINVSNNNVHDNGDNGIGLLGIGGTTGANIVTNNTVTNNGRFGIEVKLPNATGAASGAGSFVISNNTVSQSASFVSLRPSEKRDIAGISVYRRGYLPATGYADIPNGVVVTGNTVSGFIQDNGTSASEGFGIVVEGTNHTVTGNTVTGNDVGVQQQAGHTPYTANTSVDGDQNDLTDLYFGRGNSPVSCGTVISGNTYATNGVNTRMVTGGGAGTVVAAPTAVLAATETHTAIACYGGTSTVTVNVTGGTTIISYVLDGGAPQLSNVLTVPMGTHTIVVTDAGGCTATISLTLSQPAQLATPTATVTQPTCASPGQITVNTPAPAAGISYSIDGVNYSNTTGIFPIPAAGGTFSITQRVGVCTSPALTVVVNPQPVTPPVPVIAVVNNGNYTFTLTASGYTGTLHWSTGASTASITVPSSPNPYTVTQTNGVCTSAAASVVVSINDPAISGLKITNMSDVVQNTNTLLFTQNYKLKLPVFNLSQGEAIPNGTTTLTINLGSKMVVDPAFNLATAPLSSYFAWSLGNTGGHQVITGTQIAIIPADFADSAVFTVKGIMSCTSNIAANITTTTVDEDLNNNNANLQYTFPVTVSGIPTNVTCNGAANGGITVTASPGTTLSITNASNVVVSTSAVTTNLPAGVYTITAAATGDAPLNNTCTNATTVTIGQPPVLASAATGTNVSCFGGNNGTATANASGGTPSYSYVWNTVPAKFTPTVTGLTAGTYIVTITDANGCTATGTYIVSQPAILSTHVSGSGVSCYGGNNGTIAVTGVTGGTSSYTYSIAGPVVNTTGATTGAFTGLIAGVYTITTTDSKGCTNSVSYTVTQPTTPLAGSLSGTTNNICHGGTSGSISITAAGGTAGYAFTIAGPTVNTTGAATGTFTGLSVGNYTITITDANGCTKVVTAAVTEPGGTNADLSLGADYTANFFAANGVEHTIMYNVSEIGGNPAVGDTIRLTKISGYDFTFDNTLTTTTISFVPYTLNNTQWKIDNSNPAFVSLIKIDPINPLNPGTINCGQLVRVAIKMKRNTPNISTFTLSARLRKANNEVNLANNLNSIVFTAE
jgi:hypothetical protein